MGQLLQFNRFRQIVASRPVQPETVANLLLALEDAPLFPMRGAVHRRLGGHYVIVASVGDTVIELTPDEARLASHALFAEQAFVGCIETSVVLHDLATTADRMATCKGAA